MTVRGVRPVGQGSYSVWPTMRVRGGWRWEARLRGRTRAGLESDARAARIAAIDGLSELRRECRVVRT